jgi:Zn-finger nucleic acid-binding protein
MSISLMCPHCEARLRAKDEMAGKIGLCPECGKQVAVPEAKAEQAEQERTT